MLVHEKFSATRSELCAALIEREQEVDLVLTALVAQEHVLFVGPPGTAKSMLANALVEWMSGDCFTVLLTKFSTPEDVYGPISVQGLKNDVYRRIVTGKLPTATVAFIDEVFNASSAILNTLLQVLNERTFRNDGHIMKCPLQICIGASNSWPGSQEGGQELGALFDRFLLRKLVRPIGAAEAQSLAWTDEAKEAMGQIHREAKREGIIPGDRRLRKSIKAAQAFAWLQGAAEVEPDHLEILGHALWDDPAEQPRKLAEIVGQIANPSGMKINSLLMEAEQIIANTNLKDLTQAASATKKLSDVFKQLKALDGTRAEQARDHVQEEIKRIKLATIDAL